MKQLQEKTRGITLIALVITIIVLLILAGVSIAMLTGKNGILNQAKSAKEETEEAKKIEQMNLAQTEDIINETVTGVKVNQVTDTRAGILEIAENDANTLIINSVEDLVFFAYDVREGNTYEGKTVKLGLSLDFNSSKSYVDPFRTDYGKYGYDGELKNSIMTNQGFLPIGSTQNDNITTNSFKGTFDGNNQLIANLYINRTITEETEYQFYGLFANVYGTVKNLRVLGNITLNVYKNNVMTGLIAALISEPGKIENCSAAGNISVKGNGQREYIAAAGIAGQSNSNGIIEKCFNEANIEGNHRRLYLGGILGSNNKGNIFKSYNKGNINGLGEDVKLVRIGGVAGHFSGTMEYCYNLGQVKSSYKAGALAGVVANDSNITNSSFNNQEIEGMGRKENEDGIVNVQIERDINLTEDKIKQLINQ